MSVGADGTLTITSAAMGDLGEYTCVVTGENGDQQSASAFLNVQCESNATFCCNVLFSSLATIPLAR